MILEKIIKNEKEDKFMLHEVILMIIGFILLIKGADFVIKGGSNIAQKFHLSEMLIGIIIVGIGTSLPEIIVTIQSTITGNPDIIIGNSIGSCICNLLLVIGIASVCNPLKIDNKMLQVHLPVSVFSILLLASFCNFGTQHAIISKTESIILLIFAIIYILYTVQEGKKQVQENEEMKTTQITFMWILNYLILGVIGLKFGADFVVSGAVAIAEGFGVSQSIISITIVSLGTSLPEIVTCIIATLKKESNLAIGNVIGSNIFNICLLPGIGGIIKPIHYDFSFNRSLLFLLMITTYLLVFDLFRNQRMISRNHGVIFILLFCLYVSCLF